MLGIKVSELRYWVKPLPHLLDHLIRNSFNLYQDIEWVIRGFAG